MKKIILFFVGFTIFFNCFSQDYKEIGEVNDLRLIELNGKIGVIDNHENFIVTPDEYSEISFDEENWLYRCYKGKKGFEIVAENTGKYKSEVLFTDILGNDQNGMLKVASASGIGMIKYWEEFIPPIYDEITEDVEGFHSCCINYVLKKDGKKGLYIGSKLILKAEYDDFFKVWETHLIISKNNKKGLINVGKYSVEKEILLPVEYQKIDLLMGNEEMPLYKVKLKNLYGVYDPNKKKNLIPAAFQKIDWKNKKELENAFVVKVKHNNQDKYVITSFDSENPYIITEEVIYFEGGSFLAIKKPDNDYQLLYLYQNLKPYPVVYQDIVILDEGIAVSKDGKWGLLEDFSYPPLFEIKYNSLEALKKAMKNE